MTQKTWQRCISWVLLANIVGAGLANQFLVLPGGEGEPGAPAFERECFYFFPWIVTPDQHLPQFLTVDIHTQVILVVAASQIVGYIPTELDRIGPYDGTPGSTIF